MTTLKQVILYIVERRPGITDTDLTKAVYGDDRRQQQVNTECRGCPEMERRQGATHIGNYIRVAVRSSAPVLLLVQ